LTCIETTPPGLNKVMLVKVTYFNIRRVYINEIPVSLAPTITILVLLLILRVFKFFFVIIDNENGADY